MRRLVFAALVLGSSCLGGCADPEADAPRAVPPRGDISNVVYGTGTNDEGLLLLLDSPVVDSAVAEPVISDPPDQAVLRERSVFSYRARATSERARPARASTGRSVWRTWLDDLLVLERSAHAHGTPMNGDAYFLVFATRDDPALLRVFTRDTLYAPPVPAWESLADAQGTVTLSVTRATFEEGRLAADGGPFVSQPVHFTIDD
jgi:hypothetical protein